MRGGAVAARRAHNPKVAGSSPAPATNKNHDIHGSCGLRSASFVIGVDPVALSIRKEFFDLELCYWCSPELVKI